ncbi:MAG: EAL domain-containing protein, partial [Oribacterium sp.]|nr:EAL domain-containing protein [Oribacterium sp.]
MYRAKLAADAVDIDHVHYFRYFKPEMEEKVNLQSYLVSHVDEAIAKGWVQVYYQPVVSTLSHRINGFEALSRWIDPVYGFLNPDSFIDTLEDARLLYKIDLYVIECVCQDIVNAQDRGVPLSGISVNLSRHDLELPGLHEKINQILFKYRVPHDALHMEITETALLDSESIVQDHIKRFHDDGYQVWLDDFGSGYSSLNTLQNFDFDVVKIDLMFLRHETPRTHAIMASIVDMTKRIGMVALTEGVETKEQFEFLEKIGCNFAQGYYFSKPQPLPELMKDEFLKSLGLVLPDERVFFWSMSHLNFLNPMGIFAEKGEDDIDKIPFAVIEIEGEHYRALHANASIVGYAKKFMGMDNPLEGTFSRKPAESAFQGLLRHAEETGETAYYDFITADGVARLQARFVSRYRERTAFFIAVTNITSFMQRAMEKRADLRNMIMNMYDSIRESSDKPFGFFPEDGNKLPVNVGMLGKTVREVTQTAANEVSERREALKPTISEARQSIETENPNCNDTKAGSLKASGRLASESSVWKMQDTEKPFFGMQSFMAKKDAFLQKMHDEHKRCAVISLQILGQMEFVRAYDEKERSFLLGTVEEAIRKCCDEETLIGSVAPGDMSILTTCRDRSELRYLEEQLTNVLTSIHRLPDGVPVTLYFLIGGALHKESRDFTETISLAKADMKSQEEVRRASLDTKHKDVVRALSALRHAMENQTLEVLYRPRIGGISDKIVSFGTAVRWKTEDGETIPGRDYYEDIIRAGYSDEVERYVMETICRDLHNWLSTGKRVLPVNVHFALKSFEDPGYFGALREIIEKYHIDPYFLTIEFSLTELRDNLLLAEQTVLSFRNYGHRVRANKFMGDYRSVAMFGRFPLDIIRITVQDNPLTDEKSRIVMRETVNMLKKLGVYVAIDRIATKDQAEFLRAIGCNSLSGDYFGKQMLESEIDGYLKSTGYTMATQAELDMLRKLGAVNPMDLNITERVFNRKILEEHTVSYLTRVRANASVGASAAEAEVGVTS